MKVSRLSALFGAALFCLLPSLAHADGRRRHGFLNRTIKDPDGKEAKYVLFVPDDYKANGDKAYPLILFLHGSGETGSDGQKQAKVGLGPAIRKQEKAGKHFPFFAVFPQSQKRTWGADSQDGQRAIAILDAVEKEYNIDDKAPVSNRFVDGRLRHVEPGREVSRPLGRHRAVLRRRQPGQCERHQRHSLLGLPRRRGPGRQNREGRQMVEALKAAGGKPKFTDYPGVGHNCWDKAYATPELYEWLLEQHK